MLSHLEGIDPSLLVAVSGGQAQHQPQQEYSDEPPPRTWGQVARDYGAACIQGAGQSLIFAGRPRSMREGLGNAAAGCAMGVGMRAVEDVSSVLTGGGR
jgi:hypothetical protein